MDYEVSLTFAQSAHYEHMKKVLNDFQNTNRYYQIVSYTKNFVLLKNIITNDHVAYKTDEVCFLFSEGDRNGVSFDAAGLKTGAYLYQYTTENHSQIGGYKYIFSRPKDIDQILHYHRHQMVDTTDAIDIVDFNKIDSEKDQTVDIIINEANEFEWYTDSNKPANTWRKTHWGAKTNPLDNAWYADFEPMINFDLDEDFDHQTFHDLMQKLSTKTQLSFVVDIIDDESAETIISWLIDP